MSNGSHSAGGPRARPPSAAWWLGRVSCWLAIANLVLLAAALLMLTGLWAWASSDPASVGKGVLAFVLTNVVVIGGGLLATVLTLAGLIVALSGLLGREESPARPGRSRCAAGMLFHVGVVVLGLVVLVLLIRYYPYLRWEFKVGCAAHRMTLCGLGTPGRCHPGGVRGLGRAPPTSRSTNSAIPPGA